MNRFAKWMKIGTPILTFLVAVFLGKVIEAYINPLFDSSCNALLFAVVLACVLMVIVVLVVTIFANVTRQQNDSWIASVGKPAELIAGVAREGDYYEELLSLLKLVGPNDTILVVTNHRRKSPEAKLGKEPSKRVKTRNRYLETLLEVARMEGVTYRRILCFDEDPPEKGKVPFDLLPEWLVKHCQAILEAKKLHSDSISLQMSRTRFSADIFVVNNKFGTMFFRLFDPLDITAASVPAALIFHQKPNKQVVETLNKWVKELREHHVTEHIIALD